MSAVRLIKAPLSELQLVLWTHDHPMWRYILIMPTLMAQSERKKAKQRPLVKYSSCCRGVIKYAMFVSAVDVTNSRRSASPGSLSLEEIVLPLNVRRSEECSFRFRKKKVSYSMFSECIFRNKGTTLSFSLKLGGLKPSKAHILYLQYVIAYICLAFSVVVHKF